MRRWQGQTLSNRRWEPVVNAVLSPERMTLSVLPTPQRVPEEVSSRCHSSDQLNNPPLFWLSPLPCFTLLRSYFLVAGLGLRFCFLGTQVTRPPEPPGYKLSVVLGIPRWPLPQSPVLQGLKPLSQKPLLLGIWIHPRLCQREALRERLGRQKGGGGPSSRRVVAGGWDRADRSFAAAGHCVPSTLLSPA